jgi:hypothetical protein
MGDYKDMAKMTSRDKMHMKEYGKEMNRHEKMDMVNENEMARGKPVKNGSILKGYGDKVGEYDALMKKCCAQ